MNAQLILLRHGQCEWESEQRFVGWADTELTERGVQQAREAGRLLAERSVQIDAVYTSLLRRATDTAALVIAELERPPATITRSWRLNARHYGALEGRSKRAISDEYGREQVYAWRRQPGCPPPALDPSDRRHPRHDDRYRSLNDAVDDAVGAAALATECFGGVRERLLGYHDDTLKPQLAAGQCVLVVAHGSSLRPLIQRLCGIDDTRIVHLDIPTAEPLVCDLDERGQPLSWSYLGGRANIAPLHQPAIHRALRARGVRYVALAGAPGAPQVPGAPEGEADHFLSGSAVEPPPAVLIMQEDVSAARSVLARWPGCATCRIYGTLGQDGTDHRKLPYLPPHVAESVVSERRLPDVDMSLPAPLPSVAHGALIRDFDRLYHHSHPPADPDDLHEYLRAQSFCPPLDLMGRMSWCNEWIRGYLAARTGANDADPGLAVFILRAVGMQRGGLSRLTERLDRAGFEILASKILSDGERRQARAHLRIGRWGCGPWPASGGGPAALVVVYDLEPLAPGAEDRARFPWLSNSRTLVKERIRAEYNAGLSSSTGSAHCNVLHATDNSPEAREIIDLLMPEARDFLAARCAEMTRAFRTDETVTRRLTRFARRAKVEVVLDDGEEVVKKTFKPSKLRFCRREREAGDALRHVPQVPALLAAADNAVWFEYFPDAQQFDRRSGELMPLAVAHAAIDGLRQVYEAGYALLDARPENLLITTRGVKLIDFEFLHRYEQRPPTFADSYDMAGCPDDFTGDRPKGGPTSYARDWQPFIGLTLDSLLHDPVWLQHGKRLWGRIRQLLVRLGEYWAGRLAERLGFGRAVS